LRNFTSGPQGVSGLLIQVQHTLQHILQHALQHTLQQRAAMGLGFAHPSVLTSLKWLRRQLLFADRCVAVCVAVCVVVCVVV